MFQIIGGKHFHYFIALTFSLSSCTQEITQFEGIIHYKHTLESCSPNYPYESLRMTVDTASAYYYKDGNYKWVNVSAIFREDLYLADENRNYFLLGPQGDVYYGEGSDQDEDILEFSMEKNQAKILGYDCDMLSLLTLKRKDSTVVQRYIYYSPEIKIDPAAFSKLRFLSHNFIASKTHSLPLKMVMHSEEFEITWQAVDVEFKALNDSIFYIAGMTEASPINRISF